jgi:EAL domain-containing protein (putative c-di-GMP-specific phosphodiesterase class I)
MARIVKGPGHRIGLGDNPLGAALAERDADTIAMVREALDHGRTMLAYQPVVQTNRPDRPAFWEGLVRVADRSGRIIPARDFIDAVEADEIGRRLDVVALTEGLKVLAEVPDLRLSINMSARSIGYPDWMRSLKRGIDHDPTIAERLILEITEHSAIVVPDHVRAFMAEYQVAGVSFAVDDFGSGYTSLRHLRDFYFDILKIDGQFIRGVHASPDNQVLIRAMISLARHFDMLTVAEHVETMEEVEYLAANGVDCLQGHYFGAATTSPPWSPQVPPGAIRYA